MFFKLKKGSIISVKNQIFTTLPYSVFRLNLMPTHKNLQLKVNLGKFKYKGGIMALRAPKHFKAGKQFYSKATRIVNVNLCNKLKLNKNILHNLSKFQFWTACKNISDVYNVSMPSSITKSKTLVVRMQLKTIKIL